MPLKLKHIAELIPAHFIDVKVSQFLKRLDDDALGYERSIKKDWLVRTVFGPDLQSFVGLVHQLVFCTNIRNLAFYISSL